MYGKTKMTGNIGDAIKFGKIAVFLANYTSNLDFIVPEKKTLLSSFTDCRMFNMIFRKNTASKQFSKI
ncbi:hypothetical protein [Chryseobacterium indoltheticum]|uniref:hypothetical protein n=1 Tax=Chryseobacterium indoltheticum TaxID=254 RepID=UPI003F491F05